MQKQNPDEEGMLISELARQANVSVRTIRFYISEGLLPAPQARGRFASYDEDALLRLQAIRRLKEAFLPLREIRERLSGLSTTEVRQLLTDLEQLPAAPQTPLSPAVDYIDRLMARKDAPRRLAAEPVEPYNPARPRKPAPARPPSQPLPERWRHYPVAPGIVVMASDALDGDSEKQLEELLRIAKHLFSSRGVKHV